MNEFVFESAPWEQTLENLEPGGSFSAMRFLALMEGEEEWAVEEMLLGLEEKHILLDVSDLPKMPGSGETAVRLRREEQLVATGNLPGGLEERDPLRLYLEELASLPAFGDVHLLAERLLEGDRSVAEQLTNLMLSRVLEMSYEMVGRGVLLLDLIQEGSLGLWQGLTSYSGGNIEEYCDFYIRSGLARIVTMQARDSGLGQKMRQALEDYRAVDERLLSELGRNPTLKEIAAGLHMTVEEAAAVEKMLDAAQTLARATKPEDPEQDQAEEQQAVEDTAYFQTRQRIGALLSALDETQVRLLTLRFGLEGGKPLSPEETGKKLGLTPEEVVTAEAAALAKLRANG